MKKVFSIQEINDPNVDLIIYVLGPESILGYLPEIEDAIYDLGLESDHLNVLFDTLLFSGNSSERFIRARFLSGEFDSSTFEFIEIPENNDYRMYARNFFDSHIELINNSPILNLSLIHI